MKDAHGKISEKAETGPHKRGFDAKVRGEIEAKLSGLPLVEFAWTDSRTLPFSERVRAVCRQECPRYGTSWGCPPGVGTVEECRERCARFDGAFVFTTVAEVTDIENMEETLATRPEHDKTVREVRKTIGAYASKTLALSGESCSICESCTYPEAPCRCPEQMMPCIEAYGIAVPVLAEMTGIAFCNGGNLVTWFGLILYQV